ncbi:MAG: NTP transferase domain-containing protein, partial [Bacteroidetes bacterium]|nr:NTP transferase domain-containing protein [Bacteroidota bacterium]
MTSKDTNPKGHKKHAALSRPAYGHFGRNEWAILGMPCERIKALTDTVFEALSPAYRCAYIDAEHTTDEETPMPRGRLHAGAVWEYTNKEAWQQIDYRHSLNAFQYRQLFSQADMVLVNGHHFEAAAQIVVIDEAKKASLIKRLGQLGNVQLILLGKDMSEPFDFIQDALPGWRSLPLFRLEETDKIIAFFKNRLQASAAPLRGLVLAGGQSLRMNGHDKGAMDWHGKEQRYYAADLLQPFCGEVFISCRPGQETTLENGRPVLIDSFTGLGPYGAILSAFRQQPDSAWLVVACDMPLLDAQTISFLVSNRDRGYIASSFNSPHDGLPEPLIAIWEPKSYPILLSFLSQGYSCPRKVLMNSDTLLLDPPHPDALMNV